MVEVGGKIIEIDAIDDDVPQVGAAGVLGATGFEAGRLDAQEEGKFVKRLIDPRLPTEEEVAHHELTHLPYRNWCPVCVKAKGKDLDHRGAVDKERKLSEYCFDYCFPGDEFGYKLTVLVGTERLTGMKFATAVPTKGLSGKFAVDRALEFLAEVGHMDRQVIIKNDQEPSIQYFIKDMVESRVSGRTHLEESPVKSSGSNGVVERAAQEIEGRLRAILLEFESRVGEEVDARGADHDFHIGVCGLLDEQIGSWEGREDGLRESEGESRSCRWLRVWG